MAFIDLTQTLANWLLDQVASVIILSVISYLAFNALYRLYNAAQDEREHGQKERDNWQHERNVWQKEREAWQQERTQLITKIIQLTSRVTLLEQIEAENQQLKQVIIQAQHKEIEYLKKLASIQRSHDALIDY